LKSDNGDEYYDDRVEEFYTSRRICKVKTIPTNPNQNGMAERMNRIILEHTKSMQKYAGLPSSSRQIQSTSQCI